MLRYVILLGFGALLQSTAHANPPRPQALSIAAFSRIAERCVQSTTAKADSVAAACACRALEARMGKGAVQCFATPYLIGFVGKAVPLPRIHRSRNSYYGLAFAPQGLDLTVTEQYEVFKLSYGVASPHAGLPPRWYLLTHCAYCD